jgi:hypothetical protein
MEAAMRRECRNCGKAHSFAVVAPGDFERSFDFEVEWRGLRLLCPACGALLRTSFRPLALTNRAPPGLPADFRVYAVAGPGPEIAPFPRRSPALASPP